MTLKTSCFSVSGAIIKADIKRYWGIPVLATIVLFLETAFYVLVNYRDIMSGEVDYFVADSIRCILNQSNPMAVLWLCAIAVGSTMLVFSYLMNSGPVMSVHSQPFTRSILINSHSISALLFSTVPMLICGLLLLILSRPVYYPEDYYTSGDEMENLFDRMAVLQWMWENLVTILFVLAISIAAAMITGTVLHHGIAAVGFNIVVPSCLILAAWHMQTFLNGFTPDSTLYRGIAKTIPAAEAVGDSISAVEGIVYILVAAVIYVLASFLYQRRRVERATDGVVFRSVSVVITWIFGYLGMSLCGLVASEIFDSSLLTAAGYAIGALLGMVICRMIIMKTAKVMNRNTLKIMGVYAVMALVFFGVLMMSDSWYSKAKPDMSRIESVEVRDDTLDFKGCISLSDNANYVVKTEEGIRAVMELQDTLADNKTGNDEYDVRNVTITYKDKDGADLLRRNFRYKPDDNFEGEVYDAELAVLNLPEVKQNWADRLSQKGSISEIYSIYVSSFAENESDNQDYMPNKDLDELGKAMAKDLENRDFSDFFKKSRYSAVDITFELQPTEEELSAIKKELKRDPTENEIKRRTGTSNFSVTFDDVNTLNWLKDHGFDYSARIDYRCDAAVIYLDGGMDPEYGGDSPDGEVTYDADIDKYNGNGVYSSIPESDASRLVVEKGRIPELVRYLYIYDRNNGIDSSIYSGVTFLCRNDDGSVIATAHAYIKKSDIAHFAAV
ncbi:MAG: hypothetical protein K5767_00515 [Clostridia bacterium]|nr:hypothetical protein [Clostridia bacterium]